jgi:hypothetical protein
MKQHRAGHAAAALQNVADERSRQQVLPVGFVPADCEPRWRTMLGRRFGR